MNPDEFAAMVREYRVLVRRYFGLHTRCRSDLKRIRQLEGDLDRLLGLEVRIDNLIAESDRPPEGTVYRLMGHRDGARVVISFAYSYPEANELYWRHYHTTGEVLEMEFDINPAHLAGSGGAQPGGDTDAE